MGNKSINKEKMEKLEFFLRIISKVSLLVVASLFFTEVVYGLNAFQLSTYISDSNISFVVTSFFIAALFNFTLIFFMIKDKVRKEEKDKTRILSWIVHLFCFWLTLISIVIFMEFLTEDEKTLSCYLMLGFYVISLGSAIFDFILYLQQKKNNFLPEKVKTGLVAKQSRWGWVFIAPWLIGFVVYFAIPLFKALTYTFSDMNITSSGLSLDFCGLDNYVKAFTVDPDFTRAIVDSTVNIVYQVPIIVFFSLFIALLLRNKFKGRTLMRSIFFLPVIISSGVVITILKENVLVSSTGQESTLFQTGLINEILVKTGLNVQIVKMITATVGAIFDLTWKSGVQILLLLSALHSIPDSMYEAARIEGATEWETFWKITFIMISPTIVMTVIYSIIDYFTDYSNKIMRMIVDYVGQGNYAYSTTISIVYFVIVLLLIGLVNKFLTKNVNKALN